jgi:ParB family transcriptional regulator, chromosome partitioning protein
VEAHLVKTLAAKPTLVQISTSYQKPQEGSTAVPRGKYVAIQEEKPKTKEDAQRPEYKVCKFTTEAIIAEGSGKGTTHKVCANPDCPVHHPKKHPSPNDAKWKAERERERKQEAISRATGLRTLEAIGNAVPVRLMKRELLYIALMLAAKLDLPRMEIVAKLHHVSGQKEEEPLSKTMQAYLRRSPEGTLSRLIMEMSILLRMSSGQDSNRVLAEAAKEYSVNVETIASNIKKEFAAREKAKAEKKAVAKAAPAKAVAKKKLAA